MSNTKRKHGCGNPDKDYCVRREDTLHMGVGMVMGAGGELKIETASCMFCGRKIKIVESETE